MPVAARVDPKDFFTPEEWAPLIARSSWKGLALVAHAWAVILLAGAAAIVWPFLIPLAVMIIGTRQLGLAILMHEAAHGGLHPDKRVNDFVGHWLCAVPLGANLSAYRPYHLQHHKFAQQPEDPDLVLSAPFPVTRASLRRKIIRDLTGQTFYRQRIAPLFAKAKFFKIPAQPSEDLPEGAVTTAKTLGEFLLFNLAVAVILALVGLEWAWFALWLLPLAIWFPLVTRLRNIAEHAVTPDPADPLRHARTTHAAWWERAFVAPYWVNYHCEHHMFMYLPCWSLPKAHKLLKAKGRTARMEVQPGYWGVLRMASAKADVVR
jgi:fatty acid desaturase